MKLITHFWKAGIFVIIAFTLLFACSDEDDNYNYDPDNYYPTCKITNPGLDSKVVTGGRLTITVNATDYVGEVRKIEFYHEGDLIGTDDMAPYIHTWKASNDERLGMHLFTASSINNLGNFTTDSVWVKVIPPGIPPVAGFTYTPVQGMAPLQVQFTDTSLNSPTSWIYIFSNGKNSREQNPLYTFEENGVYSVTFKVMNDYGSDTVYSPDIIYVGTLPGSYPTTGFMPVNSRTFQMGNEKGDADEKPLHPVKLSYYQISKYEITAYQYAQFLNEIESPADCIIDGYQYLDISNKDCPIEYSNNQFIPKLHLEDHPVTYVSWYGAYFYALHYDWSLPTEAEWEYASRDGQMLSDYIYSGSDDPDECAWYAGNSSGKTHMISEKLQNKLQIYDMSGNVAEWCMDYYGADYYSISPSKDPTGPTFGSEAVVRGGSYKDDADQCRCTKRNHLPKESMSADVGFRVVKVNN